MNSLQTRAPDIGNVLSRQIRTCLFLVVLFLALRSDAVLADDLAPQLDVSPPRRVFHNGEHNAFTDLCRFHDQLYLTFRSCPDGHMVHPTASIIILRSRDDGANWD